MSKTIEFFKNPEYIHNEHDWKIQYDLYTGVHKILVDRKYLWAHEFENDAVKGGDVLRAIREQRTRYCNLVKPILQAYLNILFDNDPDFSEVEQVIPAEEWRDVDGKGTNFLNFIKNEIALNYFLYGKSIVLVDATADRASSKLEEEQKRLRPFMQSWNPLFMPDWDIESGEAAREGKYNLARFEYQLLEPRFDLSQQPKMKQYTKVLSCLDGYYEIKIYQREDDKQGDYLNNPEIIAVPELQEIPITVLQSDSWLQSSIPLIMLRHNLQSALDNTLNYQAYQKIMVAGPFREGDGLIMNEACITMVPEGSSITAIDPADPVALRARLESVTADIWRTAFFQTRILNNDSKSVEAAATQRESKDMLIKAMKDAGTEIEEAVNSVVRNYALFKSKKDFEGRVKFDLDLSIENIEQIMNTIAMFQDTIRQYPTWDKESNKKIAKVTNIENIEDVVNEIDAGRPANVARAGIVENAFEGV